MPEDTSEFVPIWFWAVLEKTRPSLQRLVEWLEAATREQIIEFQRSYVDAAQEICDYWDGPIVDGIGFSEDNTEDLCEWIVSQGHVLWRKAIEAPDLEYFVRIYWAAERKADSEWPAWDISVTNPIYRGYQSPGTVSHAVFQHRFSEDLHEYLA